MTQGPGLVGALLVGVATAKGLAAARRLPLAPVDHLQGHVAANFLAPHAIEPPFLCLIASGGHTLLARVTDKRGYEVLGTDARRRRRRGVRQGRAPARARLPRRAGAVEAGARRATRPRSRSRPRRASPGLDFSFAGLKTALLYAVRDLGEDETRRRAADLAASYEHAIVEALCRGSSARWRPSPARGSRSAAAWRRTGGCASAPRRSTSTSSVPPPELCTDNAAMIASAARCVEPVPFPGYLALDAYATGRRRAA